MGLAIIIPNFTIPQGHSGIRKVTLLGNGIPCTGMEITYGSVKDNTVQFVVSFIPSNTTERSVSWSVSSSTYASIDSNGLLTIKKAGNGQTVTVTATNDNGKKQTISYRLVYTDTSTPEVTPTLSSISISKGTVSGNTVSMNVTYSPSDTPSSQKGVTWSITSGSTYASINASTGVITVKATGTITVQATSTYNNTIKSNALQINVTYSDSETYPDITYVHSTMEDMNGQCMFGNPATFTKYSSGTTGNSRYIEIPDGYRAMELYTNYSSNVMFWVLKSIPTSSTALTNYYGARSKEDSRWETVSSAKTPMKINLPNTSPLYLVVNSTGDYTAGGSGTTIKVVFKKEQYSSAENPSSFREG